MSTKKILFIASLILIPLLLKNPKKKSEEEVQIAI
jgi:hypothetical protein